MPLFLPASAGERSLFMKRRFLSLWALVLACLLVLAACDKPDSQGNTPDDPDQQQGSSGSAGTGSGGSTDQPDGSGSGSAGGTDSSGSGSSSSGTSDDQSVKLGEVDGVAYWLRKSELEESGRPAVTYQLYAVGGTLSAMTLLYTTDGVLEYAAGSLEQSGNTALYFTAAAAAESSATLYCYDLYSKEVRQVLAAPCSNMVVFSGSGDLEGYGWILQEDYVMAIDLKSQTADMTMAASTMELGGFAGVGSFFGVQKSASVKESEYGVLEITLTTGSSLTGYLYTCDTFTAVKIK